MKPQQKRVSVGGDDVSISHLLYLVAAITAIALFSVFRDSCLVCALILLNDAKRPNDRRGRAFGCFAAKTFSASASGR